jgi:hypothetical protein
MVAAVYTRVILAAIAALTLVLMYATPAHAQDMSAELAEFNAECFTESGEFEGTDGCFEWAEENIELENLLESIEKGCVLSEMYEDYSCKGATAPSSSTTDNSAGVTEQGSVTEQGASSSACFTVDMTDPEVSGEDIDVLTQHLGFDVEAGNPDELLYSPECFEQGLVQWDASMLKNPCYDVVGMTLEDAVPEYIGCPERNTLLASAATQISEQELPPLTQKGTRAPANWKERVTPVKPAPKYTLSKTNPLVKEVR